MDGKKIRLRIITPQAVKVDEEIDMAVMRCINGDMGVLHGHQPHAAILDYGVLRLLSDGTERRIAIFGGIAEIQSDVLSILTSDAEWPEDIDRAHAEAERDHAERYLQESSDDLELQSTQVQLRRALVRIEVSMYPLISSADFEE